MVASRPEHDYAALVFAGAEAVQLELTLERADREVTEREADSAALVIAQMRELVAAVAGRLPHPSVQHGSTKRPPYGNNLQTAARTKSRQAPTSDSRESRSSGLFSTQRGAPDKAPQRSW